MGMAAVPSTADFVARFPEFDLPVQYQPLVEAKLAEAARSTNADVFPTLAQAEDAVMLKAAVLLSESPYAREMRLSDVSGARYEYALFRKQRAAVMGRRVF